MNQDSVEFTWIEQPVDAVGKQDMRIKNSPNCGARMPVAETHWNAVGYKIRRQPTIAQRGQRLRRDARCVYAKLIGQAYRSRQSSI